MVFLQYHVQNQYKWKGTYQEKGKKTLTKVIQEKSFLMVQTGSKVFQMYSEESQESIYTSSKEKYIRKLH